MNEFYQIYFSHISQMEKIKKIVSEIAKTEISILIKGEKGTGKKLIAQAIHLNSDRYSKPFIKVNCIGVSKGLLETELFGCEKGAPRGTHQRKPGKFELANGGTILLGDLGEIDTYLKLKLLQVLRDGEFARLGGNIDIPLNTRVVTTVRTPLEKSSTDGFLGELFSQINVMTINVPPLRDRRDQIVPFSEYFFALYKKKYGRQILPLSSKTVNAFEEYHWPGNIGELEDMIKQIVIFGEEKAISQSPFQKKPNNATEAECIGNVSSTLPTQKPFRLKEIGKKAVEEAEKGIIQNALKKTHWNRKETAKLLHVSYRALLYKIQRYRLNDLREPRRA